MKDPQAWPEYCKSLAPAIVETCTHTAVNTGPAGLVAALGSVVPEWKFRHAFSRGGWYRLGGVYDGAGERVSDSLEAWVDAELDARGGELEALLDDYAGQAHYASRLVGQTHYLVAPSGEGAGDFIQLEIECLQEVRAHALFATTPDSVEDLVDPPRAAGSAALPPIGLPTYTFRRLQHVGDFLRRMLVQKPEPAPIHRLLTDWDRSSAGIASAFSNHWVILTQEHQDRYQQPVLHARPLATLAGHPPEFSAKEWEVGRERYAVWAWIDRNLERGIARNAHGMWLRRDWQQRLAGRFGPYTPHLPFDDRPFRVLCPDGGAQLRFETTWSAAPLPFVVG